MTTPPYKSPHGNDIEEDSHTSRHDGYLEDVLFDVPSSQYASTSLEQHAGSSIEFGDASSLDLAPSGHAPETPFDTAMQGNNGYQAYDRDQIPQQQPKLPLQPLAYARRFQPPPHLGMGHHHSRSASASHGLPQYYPTTHSTLGMSSVGSPDSTASSSAGLPEPSRAADSHDTASQPGVSLPDGKQLPIPGPIQNAGSRMNAMPLSQPALNQQQHYRNNPVYQSPSGEVAHALSPSQSSPADLSDFADEPQQDKPTPGQSRPPANQNQSPQQQQTQPRPVEIQKTTDIKARACDECRRRKTACYYLKGNDSKCFRCQMEDVDCTFSKRQGGNQGAGNGSAAGGPAGIAGGARPLPISQRTAAKHTTSNSTAVPSGPIEDYSQLPGRSLLKKSLSLQHPRSSFSVGQHGLWDQRVLESVVLDKSGQARISANLSLRKVGSDSWFMVRNEGGHSDWIRDCDEIERTVYPYGRALVNSFFMFFHPEYPVLHEKIFIEKYLRTYRELMPALLGAVYLLGMRWWYHSPELATVARPHHVMPALYDLVIANFFKSSGGASLSLIQAGLLLLQCSFADTRHLSICSVINATAYRLALNRNCLHWKLPRWEINLRLRLSWATYSQSTWVSLFESIPPLTQDASWFLSPLNSDNFDSGTYEPSQGGALFIQLNKLSLIVHDIHNLLSSSLLLMYSSTTSAEQAVANNVNTNSWASDTPGVFGSGHKLFPELEAGSTETPDNSNSNQAESPKPGRPEGKSVEDILELIKPIQIRLRQWYNGLPTSLSNIEGDKPTGNFSLRLAYIAAEVSLHRFIIRAITSQSVLPSSKNPELLKIVKSSARDRLEVAASLISSLRPQHLQQFWYFASAYQFAVIGLFAALMYTTSDSQADADYYWNMLHNFVTQLQMYSDSDVISAALRTLRSSISGVPGLAF